MTGQPREILFLAHRVPYPPNRGDKIRSWHVLRALAKIAPVHVCALWDDARDLEYRDVLESVAASVSLFERSPSKGWAVARALGTGRPASVELYRSAALHDAVDRMLAERPIHAIYAFSNQMAQYLPAGEERPRIVMDFVDMDSAKFAAYGGVANGEEARRLLAWEKAVARNVDVSLFVSEAEAALFASQSGVDAERVRFLENGIDLEAYDPEQGFAPVSKRGGPMILFTGQMDYRPNVEAVAEFATGAMPQIRSGIGNARFHIVGRNPAREVHALAMISGVDVEGEVPDMRAWLAAADVVVAPLLLARGIQNKVLEAMAMAKPVVASSAAAEGIDAGPGEELVIADGPAAQAEAVKTLLRNPDMADAIGAAARRKVEARYSWASRLALLPELLELA